MASLRPEDLAAHAASIRALAAHLLRDEHLGEDVSQDAVVAALERPPRAGTRIGPWLHGVARHLSFRRIRSETRRRRREASSARGEASAEDDVVERMETRQTVAAALLSLEEPYRRTLLLRYFEDLEPTEIARRDGVPAGTVRSRLKRGLDLLRTRLDSTRDGDRRAWALPLAALLRGPAAPTPVRPRPSSVPLVAGALLMGSKTVAAALFVLAAAGAAWFAWPRDGGGPPTETSSLPTGASTEETPAPAPPHARAAAPAAEAPAVPEEIVPPAPVRADVWVAGRVVGEGRHPAADVEVRLVPRRGDPSTTRTDAAGRFRLPAALPADDTDPALTTATVRAVAADGRATLTVLALRASRSDVDAGTLVLGPAQDVEVRVEDGGAPAAGVGVVARTDWVVAWGTTDAAGRVLFERLPARSWSFEARDAARGHAVADGVVPVAGEPVLLRLTRRELVVAVVRKGTGAPVADVRLDATFVRDVPGIGRAERQLEPPIEIAPTGPDGRTTVPGVAEDDEVRVAVLVPRALRSNQFQPMRDARSRPGETELRIELPAARTYRWRISEGEAPAPAEGTVLDLVPHTNSGSPLPAERAVVSGGEIVVAADRDEHVSCFARAADGTLARLFARPGSADPGETSFRRERTIEVAVRTPGGAPARGVRVLARDQGNNAMVPAVEVGEDGVGVIRGLYGWLAEVYALPEGTSEWGGLRIGSVDLEKGSGKLEFTLPAEHRVVLRFDVDGRAALPTRFSVVGARIVGEDPAAGTATVAVPVPAGAAAPASAHVEVVAEGYPRQTVQVPAGDGAEAAVTLRVGATLVARILQSADRRAEVRIQRWDRATDRWTVTGADGGLTGMRLPIDPTGHLRIEGLEPGRLRLIDTRSRLAGTVVEVAGGATGDAGTLDLSRSGDVRGRVVAPDGASAAGARVLCEGEGLVAAGGFTGSAYADPGGGNVGRDGSFAVRVPGDRPVRLRVTHPLLRPATDGGTAEVVEPREGVELRLERGSVVTLRGQEPLKAAGSYEPGRVLVFSGEPGATPVATLVPVFDGGALRFGAPAPGRYTLWIDVAPWAPLVLRDVAIGGEDLDLGPLTFSRGSSVRIRLLVKEGQDAPRVSVWASPAAEPRCSRGVNSNGEKEFVLRGLGPGRHEIQAMPVMGTPSPIPRRTVDVDGAETTEVTIDVDLR